MTESEIMSISDYAKSVGKSRQYIHKLYKQGRLKKAIFKDQKTGQIMIKKQLADKLTGLLKKNDLMEMTENDNLKDSDADFESLSFDQSRHMKVFYEAKQERVKYEEKIEKLISADDVEKDAFKTAIILRDSILSIPAQVAPISSSMTSIFEIKNTLTEYLKKTLQNICNENLMLIEKDE